MTHTDEELPITISSALAIYISELPDSERISAQSEISNLIRWVGIHRDINSISPQEIGMFSENQYSGNVSKESGKKLAHMKVFLKFLKSKGYLAQNLASHIKYQRSRNFSEDAGESVKEDQIYLTPQGHKNLVNEYESLNKLAGTLSEDIRKAAADGDVRENAPLEAARERHAMTISRMRDIESILNVAMIRESGDNTKVSLGSRVSLKLLNSSTCFKYQIVEQNEINPLAGKISDKSPVGSAVLGCQKGQQVSVSTPRGTRTYYIESID